MVEDFKNDKTREEWSKTESEMVNNLKFVIGERSEKEVFTSLKRYFQKHGEEVLVLYSFKFIGAYIGMTYTKTIKDRTFAHIFSKIAIFKSVEKCLKLKNSHVFHQSNCIDGKTSSKGSGSKISTS